MLPVAILAAAPLAAVWGCGAQPIAQPIAACWRRLSAVLAPGSLIARCVCVALVVALAASGIWQLRAYYRPGKNAYGYYHSCLVAGRILDRKLPADALLVVGDIDENAGTPARSQSPTMLYYCNRKGWQITPDDFGAKTLDSLGAAGADYFVAAAGYVVGKLDVWQDLLQRGVTTAATFPEFYTDDGVLRAAIRRHSGPDRHILVIRLVDTAGGGN